jgi:cell division septum initiation protein DivIVA
VGNPTTYKSVVRSDPAEPKPKLTAPREYSTLGSVSRGLPGAPEGGTVVITEPAKTFSRMFRGYDPAAVDAYIEVLISKQQLLLDDVERLRAALKESGDNAAALQHEVALLTDTSPSPHAVQYRMANMLRRALDEVSEMQTEAREGAEALIAAAEAETEAARRKHNELLADMAAQRKALEAEYEETKKKLDAELARMRAETQAEIDEAGQDAQQEREQLLADAKQAADYYREQAERAVDEASKQRIRILEQLMGVYRDLEAVPGTLELAYQEGKNPPDASVVVPLEQKISTG